MAKEKEEEKEIKEPEKVEEKIIEVKKDKKKRKPMNIFLLFFIMLIFFIGEEILCLLFPGLFYNSTILGKYGPDLIYEIAAAILIFVIVIISGHKYIFTEKKEKFWKSLGVGLPFVVMATLLLLMNLGELKNFNIYNFTSVLFLTIFVGIYEELLCRGWLLNSFVRKHNEKYGSVILSVALSSLIFGLMHITNALSGQTLFETIMQIVQATAMGFFLGGVYYRTKNIFAVMFMHAYWDFAIMLGEMNLLKDCTTGTVTNDILVYSLVTSGILSIMYIIWGMYVLRREKVEPLLDEPRRPKAKRIYNIILIVAAIGAFVGVMFTQEPEGYEKYEICYDYKELELGISEMHYSQQNKFVIDEVGFGFELYSNDNKLYFENNNTDEKIMLSDSVENYELIKEPKGYLIVTITHDKNFNQMVNVSELLTIDKMNNDKDYLEKVKKSFKSYVVPDHSRIGYLTNDGTDFVYPLIDVKQENSFVIDEKGDLYLVKFTYEEYKKKAKEEKLEEVPDEEVMNAAEDPLRASEEIVGSGITDVQIEDVLNMTVSE